MKLFSKYTLLAIAVNIIIIFACLFIQAYEGLEGFIFGLMLAAVFIIVETIVALFMLANEKTKLLGQAMLLSIGIIFLIGFSWCGLDAIN